MNQSWSTRAKDVLAAEKLIEEYANLHQTTALGLFEVFHESNEKCFNVRIASWVVILADYFKSLYGPERGDFVTKKVITHCLSNGQTLH